MADFRGNIDNWIRLSEPDYYTFFIKAWIPFNAWYVAEMPQHMKKDKLLIKELQDNPKSRPRLRVISLLKGHDYESQRFKYHLAHLHKQLEKRNLSHNNEVLSFTRITLSENPVKHKSDTDRFKNKYKAEVKTGYFEALVVDRNNKTLLHYKRPTYDLIDLTRDIHYIGLQDRKVQMKIVECFREINPNKPTNLLSISKIKGEFLLLDDDSKVKFINDSETIAKGCIQTLYALRCMLFHGEVDPTSKNSQVYEHAYYLLQTIVKDLN